MIEERENKWKRTTEEREKKDKFFKNCLIVRSTVANFFEESGKILSRFLKDEILRK